MQFVVPCEGVDGRLVEEFPLAVGVVTMAVVFVGEEVALVLLTDSSFSDSVELSYSVELSSSFVFSSSIVVSSSSIVVRSSSMVVSSSSIVVSSSSRVVSSSEVGSPSVVESFSCTDPVVVPFKLADVQKKSRNLKNSIEQYEV